MEHARDVDVFAAQRAGIVERLSAGLHPHARWRDAREAMATRVYRADNSPLAQTLAQACYWMRYYRGTEDDAAADALWCIVMQEHCAPQLLHVATALARYLRSELPGIKRMRWESRQLAEVEYGAGIIALRCTRGEVTRDRPKLDAQLWRRMQDVGITHVWDLTDAACARVCRVLR